MPYPAPHNVLQLLGAIDKVGTQSEIWSNTLRIGPAGGEVSSPAPAAVLDDIAADLTTWWNAIKPHIPVDTRLMGFKFNAVGTDGKYLSETTTVQRDFGVSAEGLAGGATGHGLPPQCAVVVTLHTAKVRGLAKKGRIYLPPLSTATVTQGRLAPAVRDLLASSTAQLLTNLNNWPGIDVTADPGDVCVYSKGNLAIPNGARELVTGVSVGDIFDTQRRRRSELGEQRTAVLAV